MKIAIPNEYERYFMSNFGKNWNNEGVISYDHKKEKIIDPKIVWSLSGRDYEPAFPFYYENDELSEDINKNRWWQF